MGEEKVMGPKIENGTKKGIIRAGEKIMPSRWGKSFTEMNI